MTSESKLSRYKIPFILISIGCFLLVALFVWRSSHLITGGGSYALFKPKACVEFKVFKKSADSSALALTNSKLKAGSTNNLPPELTIIVDNLPPESTDITKEILALKQDCYYAKDIIALNEAITQEESIAILAIFVPLFALLITMAGYAWVYGFQNQIKKFRDDAKAEVEEIRSNSKKDSIFHNSLLRKIEAVGARYTSFVIHETQETVLTPVEASKATFNAHETGREIENNLLTISNNISNDNGKVGIALNAIKQYIDHKDIEKRAPYLIPLRDVLILIESQPETPDNTKTHINEFLDLLK